MDGITFDELDPETCVALPKPDGSANCYNAASLLRLWKGKEYATHPAQSQTVPIHPSCKRQHPVVSIIIPEFAQLIRPINNETETETLYRIKLEFQRLIRADSDFVLNFISELSINQQERLLPLIARALMWEPISENMRRQLRQGATGIRFQSEVLAHRAKRALQQHAKEVQPASTFKRTLLNRATNIVQRFRRQTKTAWA
jgi:hypothetical protein